MNNELIQVNPTATLDSREVALMVGKDHAHLCRDIRNYIDIIDPNPTLDSAQFFTESTYVDPQNQQRPCYQVTKEGCEMIANKLTGSKGVLFTAKYVQRFNEMQRQAVALPDFTNPVIAARAWADECEAKQIAEAKVVTLTPKAEYYDKLVDYGHATGFRDTAKELGVGQKQFMTFLESHGYIFRDAKKRPRPYMTAMQYFVVKDYAADNHSGSQVLVSVAGKQRFSREISETQYN